MFSSLSRRRVLLLVVLTCVLLITLDKRGNPVIDSMRSAFARVMRPFDTATKAVVLPLERAWHGVTGYDDLLQQNQALKDQLEHVKGNDIEARSAVLEYRELLKINQLTSKFQVATPANWKHGDECIIVPSVSNEEAKQKFPDGWREVKPYLRYVAQPK